MSLSIRRSRFGRWVAAVVLVLSLAACDDSSSKHERACRQNGGTVHHDSQWGGKWETHTYWCRRPSDGLITDVWS